MSTKKVMKRADPSARNNPKTLDQYEKLIGSMAYKAAERAHKIGLPLDQEDFEQELRMKFIDSVKKWDERKNASFMNFFITVGWWRINSFFDSFERRGHAAPTVSLDSDTTFQGGSDFSSGVGDEGLFKKVASSCATPDEEFELSSNIDEVRATLTGDTLAIFNLLIDPPQIVVDQFLSKIHGAEHDRECGGSSRSYPEINVKFLCALFELSPSRVNKVRYDFNRLYKTLGGV